MAESITEGTLKQWNKKVGDFVNADEEVATIETDKIDVSVNAPSSGTIVEIYAQEEDTVEVGKDLFKLEAGEAPAGGAKEEKKEEKKDDKKEEKKDDKKEEKKEEKKDEKPEKPLQDENQQPAKKSGGEKKPAPSKDGSERPSAANANAPPLSLSRRRLRHRPSPHLPRHPRRHLRHQNLLPAAERRTASRCRACVCVSLSA